MKEEDKGKTRHPEPKKSDHDQFSIMYNESILSNQNSVIQLVPHQKKSPIFQQNHVQSQYDQKSNSLAEEIKNSNKSGKK